MSLFNVIQQHEADREIPEVEGNSYHILGTRYVRRIYSNKKCNLEFATEHPEIHGGGGSGQCEV